MDDTPYRDCELCPRRCRVDRTAGRLGRCGEGAVCRIASAGPHHGEEPCFSGTRGSGTIFFSGCSCGCFFCQNQQISTGHQGRDASAEALLDLALDLVARGVHNLNFVTPDHFWPHIDALCGALRDKGVGAPFLFNGSGYHRPEMVPAYARRIDIFMPDFKFADAALAGRAMGDRAYPDIALDALRRMVEAKGFLDPWDPSGRETARAGVLVRHLVLPGEVENSLAVLRILRSEFGRLLPLSVMSQYHPMPACAGRGAMARRLRRDEYATVCREVAELGFRHVFLQPAVSDDAFVPDFGLDEPFRGNRRAERPTGSG
jgi:putative pyruvate formate lyase activating enzyme